MLLLVLPIFIHQFSDPLLILRLLHGHHLLVLDLLLLLDYKDLLAAFNLRRCREYLLLPGLFDSFRVLEYALHPLGFFRGCLTHQLVLRLSGFDELLPSVFGLGLPMLEHDHLIPQSLLG